MSDDEKAEHGSGEWVGGEARTLSLLVILLDLVGRVASPVIVHHVEHPLDDHCVEMGVGQ